MKTILSAALALGLLSASAAFAQSASSTISPEVNVADRDSISATTPGSSDPGNNAQTNNHTGNAPDTSNTDPAPAATVAPTVDPDDTKK